MTITENIHVPEFVATIHVPEFLTHRPHWPEQLHFHRPHCPKYKGAKAFMWLPFVGVCCACVYNLKTAVVLIAVYSALYGVYAAVRFIMPFCINIRSTDSNDPFGLFVYVSEMTVSIAGGLLVLFSGLLGITVIINKPFTKAFIIVTYMIGVLEFLLAWIILIRMSTENFKCKESIINKSSVEHYIQPHWLVFYVFLTLIIAAMSVYFTLIVNSYAMLWDYYTGNIPPPHNIGPNNSYHSPEEYYDAAIPATTPAARAVSPI